MNKYCAIYENLYILVELVCFFRSHVLMPNWSWSLITPLLSMITWGLWSPHFEQGLASVHNNKSLGEVIRLAFDWAVVLLIQLTRISEWVLMAEWGDYLWIGIFMARLSFRVVQPLISWRNYKWLHVNLCLTPNSIRNLGNIWAIAGTTDEIENIREHLGSL